MMREADLEGAAQRLRDRLDRERRTAQVQCEARDRRIADLERSVGDSDTDHGKVRGRQVAPARTRQLTVALLSCLVS